MKIITIKENGDNMSFNFKDEVKAGKFFESIMNNCEREEIIQINIVF